MPLVKNMPVVPEPQVKQDFDTKVDVGLEDLGRVQDYYLINKKYSSYKVIGKIKI